jgi:hypothetical protein
MTKEQLENLQTLGMTDYKTRLHVKGVRIVEVQQYSKSVDNNAVQQPLATNTTQPQFLN